MTDREFLRHTVATLAYRAEKALRGVLGRIGAEQTPANPKNEFD